MEIKSFEGDRVRVHLYQYEYETIIDNAEETQKEIVIRLGGEVGLNISEVARVKVEHIEQLEREDQTVSFLYVPKFRDDPERTEAGRPRMALIPNEVDQLIREYIQDENLDPGDDMFPVHKRTIQGWINDTTEMTAEKTGNEDFAKVSSSDFRAYFVKNMVERLHVHPEVVMKVGGWDVYESVQKYFEDPDEDFIVDEYERVGLL